MTTTTDCLNCGETVYLDYTDNMDDHIEYDSNTIMFTFHPCKACGFVTVLDFLIKWDWTLRASEEASNELVDRTKEGWSCYTDKKRIIEKYSEEEEVEE